MWAVPTNRQNVGSAHNPQNVGRVHKCCNDLWTVPTTWFVTCTVCTIMFTHVDGLWTVPTIALCIKTKLWAVPTFPPGESSTGSSAAVVPKQTLVERRKPEPIQNTCAYEYLCVAFVRRSIILDEKTQSPGIAVPIPLDCRSNPLGLPVQSPGIAGPIPRDCLFFRESTP